MVLPVVVVVWLLSIIWAFWWFQFRWINSLEDFTQDALFSADSFVIPNQPQSGLTRVYHFYDRRCPCSRFNTEHVKKVMALYHTKGIEFSVIVPTQADLTNAAKSFPSVPLM
jgi:hypothetical protein